MSELTIADIHRLVDARIKFWLTWHGVGNRPPILPQTQEQPARRNHNAEQWHQAIDAIHDLIALSVYRHYITQPQVSDLLDLAKQLRNLVNRYEQDEQ